MTDLLDNAPPPAYWWLLFVDRTEVDGETVGLPSRRGHRDRPQGLTGSRRRRFRWPPERPSQTWQRIGEVCSNRV